MLGIEGPMPEMPQHAQQGEAPVVGQAASDFCAVDMNYADALPMGVDGTGFDWGFADADVGNDILFGALRDNWL